MRSARSCERDIGLLMADTVSDLRKALLTEQDRAGVLEKFSKTTADFREHDAVSAEAAKLKAPGGPKNECMNVFAPLARTLQRLHWVIALLRCSRAHARAARGLRSSARGLLTFAAKLLARDEKDGVSTRQRMG